MKKKVLFISEYLDPPYDEGIKKTAYHIYELLNRNYDIQVICRHGPDDIDCFRCLSTNRLFYSSEVKNIIKSFAPDTMIYLPFASSTFASYLRSFVLRKYYKKAKNIMVALQPKHLGSYQKSIVKRMPPDTILTTSPLLRSSLEKMGMNNNLLPLYTNLKLFKPVHPNKKAQLRGKYNVSEDVFVILHAGHLNKGRNLEKLMPLQKKGNQVIIVSSSSTPADAIGPKSIKDDLENKDIIIIDKYIKHMEELYQLSDLYAFPVNNPNSSIGMPLSVLEARACGVPVLTTDYGSIRHFLGNDHGGIFYRKTEEFSDVVDYLKMSNNDYKTTGVKGLNEKISEIITDEIEKM